MTFERLIDLLARLFDERPGEIRWWASFLQQADLLPKDDKGEVTLADALSLLLSFTAMVPADAPRAAELYAGLAPRRMRSGQRYDDGRTTFEAEKRVADGESQDLLLFLQASINRFLARHPDSDSQWFHWAHQTPWLRLDRCLDLPCAVFTGYEPLTGRIAEVTFSLDDERHAYARPYVGIQLTIPALVAHELAAAFSPEHAPVRAPIKEPVQFQRVGPGR